MRAVKRPLVGRARELAILREAVNDIAKTSTPPRGGRGRIVLLTGEAGIGKSRLADEAAALVEGAGGRAVFGCAWEAGSAPAFWPWIQVLRALDESSDGDDSRDIRSGPLAVLLDGKTEGIAPDRFEVFDAFARLLAQRARERELAVVLDDLHVADRASLLLLAFLAQHVRAMSLLVVGTLRDVEARLTPERSEIIARIARSATVLAVPRLLREDVAALVPGSDDVVDAVFAKTEGNPLFVDEVVRLIESRGEGAGAASTIPDGVRAAIREHLERVTAGCRALLEAASVLGRDIPLAVLSTVHGGDVDATRAGLQEAERAGLVVAAGARAWRFTHVLARDTLYDDLAPARRTDLHRSVALALASTLPAPLAEIARHYAEAGAVDDAVAYARRASRAAQETLAFEEAIPPLLRAAAIVDDPLRLGALYVELGEARIRAGDGDGGWADCRRAAAIARVHGSTELLARAALAFGTQYTFGRVDAEMVALLDEAARALSSPPFASTALHARVLARLAGAMQPAPDPRVPIARGREAIHIARELGDDDTLLAVLLAAGSALQDIADPQERSPLNHELLRLATHRGDRTLMLRARLRLAFDNLEAGDFAAADAEMRAYERISVVFRQPRFHFPSTMWGAMRALAKGDFAEHARRLSDARSLAVDDRGAELCLGCHAFLAARLRGEFDVARTLVDGARWFLDAMPAFVAQIEARLLLDRGERAEAAAALARVSIDEHVASIPTLLRGVLAETAAAVGDDALRSRVYQALLPFADRVTTWSMTGMFCEGPVARPLALLASSLGRHDEAALHAAHATAIALADGMRPLLVHLALDGADALARQGRDDDAALLRAKARDDAVALDLPALARSARTAAAGATHNTAQRVPTTTTAQAADSDDVKRVVMTLVLEGETWIAAGDGEQCRLKDSRGLRMLKKLVDNAGRELHALELAGDTVAVEGDAGPVLDERAKAAYRARLHELRSEVDEASAWNDVERQARATDELERLTLELSRALGIGGRDRAMESSAERARVNAQRRLTDAIKRIGDSCPRLGRHLALTVRTGSFCWYDPASRKRPGADAG